MKQSGLGIASFIVSIFGIIFSFLVFGIIFGIVALVLGIIGILCVNKKKSLSIWGICLGSTAVLISFLVLISVVKSSKNENSSETSGVSISTESPGMESNNSEASNEQTSAESSDAESNYSFYYGELKITINSKDLNYDTYDDPYNWYLPNDGMKYIMVSFTFENTGKYDEYVSIYDFDCYADNVLCEQAFLPDDSDFINTNLSSGRMISFQTYYQVPIDSVSIELEYGTNSWLNDKEVITIQ